MGKCISKPVVAAATAVEFSAENKKPVEESAAAGGGVVKSSSDRSLQHLFEKDVDEEEEEDGSGQLKRIPEEQEQEKPVEKSGSLETIPEDKSPESEDENQKKVVVVVLQAEKIVPAEVEKREVQVEAPVDKQQLVQVVQVGSESKSLPDEVSELHVAGGEDVEIHKHLEDSENVEVEGEVRDVAVVPESSEGEGGGEEEQDTQVAPGVCPREILDTEGVIIPNTRASLEETHEVEEDEEVDVKALKALNDLDRQRETGEGGLVDVKEIHEEGTDRHEQTLDVKEAHDSEAGTESTVVDQGDVPAQGSTQGDESVDSEKTSHQREPMEEPSAEYKRAEDDLHEAEYSVKETGTEVPSADPLAAEERPSGEDVDVQEVEVKAEEPRSEVPSAESVPGVESVENPSSVCHVGVPEVTEVLQAPSYSAQSEAEVSDGVVVDVPEAEAEGVLQAQSSSSAEAPGEEFFEACEQIPELESEQIPEQVESADKTEVHADPPQVPERAETDTTPAKVDVPTEETTSNVPSVEETKAETSNVPPEKSVQPLEETKAEPSSTG